MIKSILKTIFPVTFLKRIFLVFNDLKIKTWDKLFFPEKLIPSANFQIREEINPFLQNKVSLSLFSPEIKDKLKLWTNPVWTQDQYLLHLKENAYLEPRYGWAVTTNRRLIYPSLGFSRAPYVNKPNFLESYFYKKQVIHLSKVISLRDTGEENYFHFYNDVIPKLFFLEDQMINLNEYTVVVAEKLFKKDFFQFFFENTWLKDLNWHVQSTEWIYFSEAIFCKPFTHTKRYLDRMVNLIAQSGQIREARKIFLTRDKTSLRFIENMDEIKLLLEIYQFEIVDAAKMKVSDQIQMFSECRYLISIHGAGLTNMIFRRTHPLSILEIVQPSKYIPFHYIMLAHQYGFQYNILLGSEGVSRYQGGFRVDSIQLKKMIESMVNFQCT